MTFIYMSVYTYMQTTRPDSIVHSFAIYSKIQIIMKKKWNVKPRNIYYSVHLDEYYVVLWYKVLKHILPQILVKC